MGDASGPAMTTTGEPNFVPSPSSGKAAAWVQHLLRRHHIRDNDRTSQRAAIDPRRIPALSRLTGGEATALVARVTASVPDFKNGFPIEHAHHVVLFVEEADWTM